MNYVFKLRKVTVLLFFKETPPPHITIVLIFMASVHDVYNMGVAALTLVLIVLGWALRAFLRRMGV